jgi:hypothetical protein
MAREQEYEGKYVVLMLTRNDLKPGVSRSLPLADVTDQDVRYFHTDILQADRVVLMDNNGVTKLLKNRANGNDQGREHVYIGRPESFLAMGVESKLSGVDAFKNYHKPDNLPDFREATRNKLELKSLQQEVAIVNGAMFDMREIVGLDAYTPGQLIELKLLRIRNSQHQELSGVEFAHEPDRGGQLHQYVIRAKAAGTGALDDPILVGITYNQQGGFAATHCHPMFDGGYMKLEFTIKDPA